MDAVLGAPEALTRRREENLTRLGWYRAGFSPNVQRRQEEMIACHKVKSGSKNCRLLRIKSVVFSLYALLRIDLCAQIISRLGITR